ncbi:ATP-binding protein [Rossellomorea vietnamensis]|uniref:ATP-binding protein n=1 Tax=Rossellomorea TaxID=2837508 RepID=UPI0021CCA267|nr:ATP-binding protein [Rossellomorea aquimaris]
MKRYVILTVGKTHSGKSTFARLLEEKQEDIFVIDQDNHAEFINTHYKRLLPEEGPNTLKTAITQSIVEYAVKNTDSHLILCNSNLDRKQPIKGSGVLSQRGVSKYSGVFQSFR